MKFLNKLFGDPNEKIIKSLSPIINEINELESEFSDKKDEEIKKISRGKSLSQEEINTLLSKHKMQPIKPEEYIGLAEKLAQKAINKTKKFLWGDVR